VEHLLVCLDPKKIPKTSFSMSLQGAFACLMAWVLIRAMGINRFVKLLKAMKKRATGSLSSNDVDMAWRAVHRSPGTQFARFACLEFSSAAALLLLAKRKPITWCLGAQLQPFRSHCWLEYRSSPFREPQDTASLHKIIEI
jgi:hypothetical protein